MIVLFNELLLAAAEVRDEGEAQRDVPGAAEEPDVLFDSVFEYFDIVPACRLPERAPDESRTMKATFTRLTSTLMSGSGGCWAAKADSNKARDRSSRITVDYVQEDT